MKKTIITGAVASLLAGTALITSCGPEPVVIEPTKFPQDVKALCVVDSPEFASWFASGTPAENGLVLPANSVTFPHNNNCDFYKWSEQMFLWITSPISSGKYSSGNTVLESEVFYTVSPEVNGDRVFIAHKPGTTIRANSLIRQTGPNRLPVVLSRDGRFLEVEQAKPGTKPVVKNAMGKSVEVASIEAGSDGKPLFKDASGKVIEKPKALIRSKIKPDHIVQEFTLNGKSVFLDAQGNVVDTETGQATQDALISQYGGLVYYISFANDMYAYYTSGAKEGAPGINPNQFPTTAADRSAIVAYAKSKGYAIPKDSDALTIELKTSWVELSTIPKAQQGSYLTITATIPTYNTSNPQKWVPSGERTAVLAMVGMHVVGSAAGHPEMIWATFEHVNNAPNDSYTYLNVNDSVITVPADTGSGWLFCTNAADTPMNISHISTKAGNDTLEGKNGYAITSSNTSRTKPFGSSIDVVPNAEDPSVAASNSEVIAINNSIMKQLVGKDIRKNYYLVGATWTDGGAAPDGSAYNAPSNTQPGVAIGTSQLANSTMETYFQYGQTYTSFGQCMGCHFDFESPKPTLKPDYLSHVYSALLPLDSLPKK